jgi:hypothetical protein
VQTCHKQYKTATEMEVHLSSYDHHHKKVGVPDNSQSLLGHLLCLCSQFREVCAVQRLVEMKQMNAERTRGEREKKERKRQEKEAARLHQQ